MRHNVVDDKYITSCYIEPLLCIEAAAGADQTDDCQPIVQAS